MSVLVCVCVVWLSPQCTHPILVVDDLDDAAVLVLHRRRGHGLLWLHGLRSFLLQLLLRDKPKQADLKKI